MEEKKLYVCKNHIGYYISCDVYNLSEDSDVANYLGLSDMVYVLILKNHNAIPYGYYSTTYYFQTKEDADKCIEYLVGKQSEIRANTVMVQTLQLTDEDLLKELLRRNSQKKSEGE